MSLVFRHIKKEDEIKPFITNRESFNTKNPSGTLKEFWEEAAEYETFVLEKNNEIIGISRYREEIELPLPKGRGFMVPSVR
ncbi:MAG: hypothetical protein ACTSO9_15535 [Candidatus Helarchaeota archaeon]